MMSPALRSDATLPELLAARARAASDVRLAADVAGGVVAAAAVLFWRPGPWILLLSAALCFVAYGSWGIADRALGASQTRALRALRGLAAVLGTVAAVALVAGVVALALGTIIS
jgi:hypothetical protein